MENETENNEFPRINLRSWWSDNKGRIWLIHGIIYNGSNAIAVDLLEVGKAETIEQPFEKIQKYIKANLFKPVSAI